MKLCSFSFLVFIALTEVVVGAPLDVRSGYSIPDITMSPDGKFGVAVPDAKHYREVAEWRYDGPSLHEIVEITSGRILGAIQGHSAFIDAHSTMGQGGLRPARWSADSSLLLWEIEGKWVPTSLILVKLKDGEILWQRNLLNTIQQEMLSLTKRAAGSNYPRAERRAYGDNPSYPNGRQRIRLLAPDSVAGHNRDFVNIALRQLGEEVARAHSNLLVNRCRLGFGKEFLKARKMLENGNRVIRVPQ